jgi:hypothetical protein
MAKLLIRDQAVTFLKLFFNVLLSGKRVTLGYFGFKPSALPLKALN